MTWNDPRSAADADVDQTVVLGAALLELDHEIGRLRRQVEQQAHRLGSAEQSVAAARQDAAEARALFNRPSSGTDRCLSDLLSMCDAVLIEKEPNGQVKATAVKGSFVLHSNFAYEADAIWEARSEVGERAGGAIISLFAYMYHLRSDQFGGTSPGVEGDRP
jgi:hypothetical protein